MGVGDLFQGSRPGSTYLRIGDVCYDPPYGPGPVGFSKQGGQAYHRETALAASGQKLAVPSLGVIGAVGGFGGVGGVRLD